MRHSIKPMIISTRQNKRLIMTGLPLSKRVIGFVSIAFIFVASVYFIIFVSTINNEGTAILPSSWWILQVCVLILGIAGVASDKRSYSLYKMHWYFIVVFMGIAPIVQLTTGYYPWNYLYSITTSIRVSCIVLLWCILYLIAYQLFNASQYRKVVKRRVRVTVDDFPEWYLIAIPIAVVLLKLACNGSNSVLQAGVLPDEIKADSVLPATLDRALTAVPAFCLVIMRLKYQSTSKMPVIPLVLLVLLTLFVVNPLTSSRYQLGAVLIGLFVVLVPSAVKDRRFDFLVVLALFVVFPVMTDWARVNDEGFSFENLTDMIDGFSLTSGFTWVDFDAYSLAARTIDYVDRYGVTGGHQLASTLLFFIPDSIWEDKGQMTSDLLVEALTPGGQTNLSTPLMAEGYIDFGVIGVILFAIVAALLSSRADFTYWRASDRALVKGAYPFLLGFTIFIMRGTLLYGYMWTVSFFAGLLLLWLPIALIRRRRQYE